LGVDQRVGSIEPGKDADLTLFDKHPLLTYAKVEKVFIDGELYFDRDKDLEERPGKEARKKALIDKMKAREKEEKKKPEPSEKGAEKKGDQPGDPQ
jgi:adenine deaminase